MRVGGLPDPGRLAGLFRIPNAAECTIGKGGAGVSGGVEGWGAECKDASVYTCRDFVGTKQSLLD